MGRKRKQEPTTLLFLLQSLIDAEIIVELRNETQIVGTLDHVDNAMKYTFLRS
jgi:small nuclear ribonucleoprotein (snRNP)-like protein